MRREGFTEPELVSIDAGRLAWLVAKYLDAQRGKASADSLKKYGQKLRHFLNWANGYTMIDANDFADLARYLASTHLHVRTQADVVKRTGQMFRWAYRAGYAQADYSLWLPKVKAPARLFEALLPADVDRILDACASQQNAMRDRAMIAIMAGAGLRAGEVTLVDCADLTFHDDGSILVRIHKGKGGKARVTICNAHYGAIVKAWVDWIGCGPLLMGRKGGSLKPTTIFHKVENLCKSVGVRCSPHDFRRYFATRWIIEHPGRLTELQNLMGHSSPATTSRYIWLGSGHIQGLISNS